MTKEEMLVEIMNQGLVIFKSLEGWDVRKIPTIANAKKHISDKIKMDASHLVFTNYERAFNWCAQYCGFRVVPDEEEVNETTDEFAWHCVVQAIYPNTPKYWRLEPDIVSTDPDEAQTLAEVAATKKFGEKGKGWKEVRIRPLYS